MKKFFAAAAFVAIASASYAQDVVINEFDTQTSSDEFIELYNPTGSAIDLAAGQYGLVFINGNGPAVYQSSNLVGTIPAGGYYVVTENVPATAGDQTFGGTSFQNGPDAVVLVKGTDAEASYGSSGDYSDILGGGAGTQVDVIAYGTTDDAILLAEVGTTVQIPATTAQRVADGQGGASYAVTDWGTGTQTNGATNTGVTAFAAGPVTVNDIAEALALADGTQIVITGAVTVVAPELNVSAGRNQFYVQDASGTDTRSAVLVDDQPGTITTAAVLGATITGFEGTKTSFSGIPQIVPSSDVTFGSGSAPSPLILTAAVTDRDTILSELITIEGIEIAETGTFAADTNYVITSGAAGLVVSEIRVEDGSTLVGETIPAGAFDLTGVVGQFSGTGQIFPRFDSDVTIVSSVNDWAIFN